MTDPAGFPGLLRAAVARHPDAIALVDGERRLSWQQFSETVDRVSTNLRNAGIAAGDDVALVGGNTIEFVTGLMGSLACGAAVAPPAHDSKRVLKNIGRSNRIRIPLVALGVFPGADWTMLEERVKHKLATSRTAIRQI